MQKLTRKFYFLKVADIIFRLYIPIKRLVHLFEKEYLFVNSKKKYQVDILILPKKDHYLFISRSTSKLAVFVLKLKYVSKFKSLEFIIQGIMAYQSIFHDIILLHGSSIKKNNKGYVFLGPSGVGKTTILKKVASNAQLSDDTVVIKKLDNKLFLYTSPFDKKQIKYQSKDKILLNKIFILRQAHTNRANKIDYQKKIKNLKENNFYWQFVKPISKLLGENKKQFIEDKKISEKNNLLLNVLIGKSDIKVLDFTKKIDINFFG